MKNTKRTLIMSVLSMVICVAMLAGTTFAWFTDTASTGINRIQAGNLDIGFKYWDGTQYTTVTDSTLVFDQNALWEPGHLEVAYFEISNDGTLALKYALGLNNVQDYGTIVVVGQKPMLGFPGQMQDIPKNVKLSNYINFAVIPMDDADARFATREDAIAAMEANPELVTKLSGVSTYGELDVEQKHYVALVVYMPKSVGNEINYPKINPIRFGVALNATQNDVESDSFGNDYDANTSASVVKNSAEWDVIYNNSKASSAMITVDMARTSEINIPGRDFDLTIASGTTISSSAGQSVVHVGGVENTVTITGGTVESNGTSHAIRVDQNGGTTIIKDGEFIGDGGSCIFVSSGTVIIEGGFFKCKQKALDNVTNTEMYFVLNTYNSTTMPRSIVVKGGTFVNYDPSYGDNVDRVSFVPTGYKVVSETQTNGDIWYTVVPE